MGFWGSPANKFLPAANALVTVLDFHFESHRPVPAASRVSRGREFVELPVSLAAKVLLLNEMAQKGSSRYFAHRLQMTPQEVNR